MNICEFIIEVLKAIIWPLTIFIIVILLNKELKGLLNHLKFFKVKGAEFNFEKELNDVELKATAYRKAGEKELTIETFEKEQSSKVTRLTQLAELTPKGAILETWIELEEIIVDAGVRHQVGCTAAPSNITNRSSHREIMRDLNSRGIISDYYYKIYDGLRQVRNKTVHAVDQELTITASLNFVKLSNELIRQLKRI